MTDQERDEIAAWIMEVHRRGLRLFVEDENGWLHEFRPKAGALIDGRDDGSDT